MENLYHFESTTGLPGHLNWCYKPVYFYSHQHTSFSLHSASPSPRILVIHLWFGDSNPPKKLMLFVTNRCSSLEGGRYTCLTGWARCCSWANGCPNFRCTKGAAGWYWEIRCRGALLMYFFMVCILLCALLIFVMFTWNYIIDLRKWNILVLFGIIKNQGRTWCLSNCSWWCLLWGNSKAMLQLWRLPYRKLMQLVWMQRL